MKSFLQSYLKLLVLLMIWIPVSNLHTKSISSGSSINGTGGNGYMEHVSAEDSSMIVCCWITQSSGIRKHILCNKFDNLATVDMPTALDESDNLTTSEILNALLEIKDRVLGSCQASFGYSQVPGAVGIQFSNYSFTNTGEAGESFWDFGDGSVSDETDPIHVFSADGIYEVCLTITVAGPDGTTCTSTYCEEVYIGDIPPCIDEELIDSICVCPAIYAPVCGCDGVTYGNDCEAQCNGVTSWTPGECFNEPGDCFAYFWYYNTDTTGLGFEFYDFSFTNGSNFNLLWDFGDGSTLDTLPFSAVYHQYASIGIYNVCLTVYSDDSTCLSTFCEYIVAGTPGMCTDTSVINPEMACPEIYEPVCGCDGNTYSSACDAYYAHGITSWTPGECYYYYPCDAYYYYWLDGDGFTVNFQPAYYVYPDGGVIDPPGGNGGTPTTQSVLWDFGDGTTSDEAHTVHTYTDTTIHSYWVCLTVSDSADTCSNTFCDSVYVGSYNYGCYAGFEYTIDPGGTVTVYPDSAVAGDPDWAWNEDGEVTPDGTGISFPIDSTSSDTLCITLVNNEMNCVDTFCMSQREMYEAFLLSGFGNPSEEKVKGVTIYPNPASAEAMVDFILLTQTDLSVRVMDLTGKEHLAVVNSFPQAGSHKVILNTSGLHPGIYIVEADAGGQSVFRKLVIAR